MKKYGIYEPDGKTPIILTVNDAGEKVNPYHLRAGTKGAARSKSKRYGGTWRRKPSASPSSDSLALEYAEELK